MIFYKGNRIFNWRKIIVRSSHLILVLYVAVSLFIKKTDLQFALVTRNYLYIFGYIFSVYASLFFYFFTCFKDPGYVTKLDSLTSEEQASNTQILRTCEICQLQQPLRSHHCQVCRRCVKKFDHHCPWLETCIGQSNHRYFYLFLVSSNVLIIWSIVIALKAIVHSDSWFEWFLLNMVYLFDLQILFVSSFVCFTLFLAHTYFMTTNSTTWEKAARKKITYLMEFGDDSSSNPFHEGYLKNVFKFMCYCGNDIKWEIQYKRFKDMINSKFTYNTSTHDLKETIVVK